MQDERIVYEEGGIVAVVVPVADCGLTLDEIEAKDVPDGVPRIRLHKDQLPSTRLFRGAWRMAGQGVDTDLASAKEIGHTYRRLKRAEEFAPLDIQATIPSEADATEAARAEIRTRYAQVQIDIDDAADVDTLAAVVEPLAPRP